ncbi:motile sperm domain-containing protein 1-like isoform X1 [Portunus trituberculatus]|uniref:motile sperm domain-containing protein 1-like isoform X1 n=2 Tax=Portunus trituberculatus TaxID=210409 RepID=UPI001E1CE6D1|nr:motile sperm domain-containing protein 1-like isoform X1 [Portunus trituberculatus]
MADKPKVKLESKYVIRGNVVMQSGGLDGRIPVFVFPQSLTFYVDDINTHRQILTLYNPYDFHISYNVLCNNPVCYDVESSSGVLYAKCSVGIIVKRSNLSLNEARDRDCLRIIIYEEGTKHIIGKKDVFANLQAGSPSPESGGDIGKFESVRGRVRSGDPQEHHSSNRLEQQPFIPTHAHPGPSLLLVFGAVVCLAGLLMPTLGEDEPTMVPPYLHLSSNIKIVLAYALGLLTYAILKPI